MKLRIYLMFIIFAGLTFNAYSQDEKPLFYYGFYIGYNYNMHSPDFKNIGDCENCGYFEDQGSGSGISIGGLFEYPINDKFTPYFRVGYSILNGNFTDSDVIGNTEVRDVNNNTVSIVEAVSEYTFEAKMDALHFEPGIYYTIMENWRVSAGFNLSLLLTKDMNQQEELIKPDNVVFADNGQFTRNVYDNLEIPNANSMLMFIPIGTSYDFPLGKYSRISPEIKYYLPLNDVADVPWNVSYLQMGASARFAFLPKKEKPVIEKEVFERDTTVITKYGIDEVKVRLLGTNKTKSRIETDDKIIETVTTTEKYEKLVPKNSRLEPGLIVRGITEDGQIQENPKIVIEEFETTESFPLLPYVFFKENNSDLSQTSMKLLTKEQTKNFSPEDLPENTMDIYNNMLNIIAYRTKNSNAKLTITGTNSNEGAEQNNLELSGARSNAIKDYLTNIWEIPEKNIQIKNRNLPQNFANITKKEGIIENRRAEIYSDDLAIISPLELGDIEKVANPPVIEIIPTVVHDSKIEKWDIKVNQNNNDLREFNGVEINPLKWNIEKEPVPLTETPINIDFTVKDELGQEESISKNLSISQLTIRKKRYELKDDKRIERFALILFDYDKATIKEQHKKTLDNIKSRIQPNSKVIISGFADDTGDPDYNRALAARRTSEVQKILNVENDKLTINNIGSDKLLYNNNSPQGRSYCRTVTIEIETPVK